ncbi:DUF2927 domain-containing protein [uncultured Ruegeria sp.]|uniref:DUF2927 domain-containing protein n=1 Tax=uncultured Ruegeria sp. TaxID=259304 RepID=UPI00261B33CB|nr:DUF2927 domain-containing protein [uncultured Ruegeria sp.]
MFFSVVPASLLNAGADFEHLYQKATDAPREWEQFASVPVFRWEQPVLEISFHVSGPAPAEMLKSMNDEFDADANFLAEKAKKTLNLSLWSKGDQEPEIVVFIGTRKSLWNLVGYVDETLETEFAKDLVGIRERGESFCSSSLQKTSSGTIKRAVILVDRDERPNYCLRRNLILSFGLVGSLDNGKASILALDQMEEFYTPLDGLLLERLYATD